MKSHDPREKRVRVVMDLTLQLRGQTVTCDFFYVHKLSQTLARRDITLIETIRKNRIELPKLPAIEVVHSSKFCFTETTTLVPNIPKKNKNVVLISTMHGDKEVSNT